MRQQCACWVLYIILALAFLPTHSLVTRGFRTARGLSHQEYLPRIRSFNGANRVWKGTNLIEPLDLAEAERNHNNKPTNFTLNVGRAMDSLKTDIPNMFVKEPNLDILTDDIILTDPNGALAKGKTMYAAAFASLRFVARLTGTKNYVTLQRLRYVPDEMTIEARVHIDTSSLFNSRMEMSTMSRYAVDTDGMIYEHDFDMHIGNRMFQGKKASQRQSSRNSIPLI